MRRSCVFLFVVFSACSKPPSESAPHAAESAPPREATTPSATATPTATPTVTGREDAGAPATSAPTAKDEPPPNVKVLSIGMHVAGGPHDEETKKPFLKPVEPRYPELARCWKHIADKTKPADVGVDLLIPPAGGKPKVSHPRSTQPGEGFLPCVVAFFETVDFDKPKSGGHQGVSYSVRFKPGK